MEHLSVDEYHRSHVLYGALRAAATSGLGCVSPESLYEFWGGPRPAHTLALVRHPAYRREALAPFVWDETRRVFDL